MADYLKSKRLEGIGEYYFSQKLRQIEKFNKSGRKILNLGIGNPDQEPADEVKQRLIRGLEQDGFHKYQSYKGIPELREAFTNWYKTYFHVNLEPHTEVLPLIGSKEGIMHCCMAFLNEEDQVLVPNPGYPTYSAAVKLAGSVPIPYHLSEERAFQPDIEEMKSLITSKTKMMWVNYPNMPTGADFQKKVFSELVAFCRHHQIILINDNPYGFILTKHPTSILSFTTKGDWVMELNSLSKSHNMQGWRIGMLGGNRELIQTVLTFKSQMDSGMFKPIMEAAISALHLGQSWYDQINFVYQQRQKKVYELANFFGCRVRPNQVGLFIWAKVPDEADNGEAFADHIMEKYDLFIPPGIIFGSEGDRYIRFSLCQTEAVWKEVFKRTVWNN